MQFRERMLFKVLLALTLFTFILVLMKIFEVRSITSYLPLTFAFIFLAINSSVQRASFRFLKASVHILKASLSLLAHALHSVYLKTRKAYGILFFLAILLCFPLTAQALTIMEEPKKIIIPSAGISLPVFTAKIAYDTWEVREDGASFGEHTTIPGKLGNTVIFSHAKPHLFGSLDKVKKGEYVHIFTRHDWFVYQITDTRTVAPENTEVIFNSHNHELTLYTCTGSNYEERFIVKARLLTPPGH